MKVRSPGAVFLLGLVTYGFYACYWWIKTAKDLERLDREQHGGRNGIDASGHIRLAAVGTGCWAFRQFEQFLGGYQAGRAEASARLAGASEQQARAAGEAAQQGGLAMISGLCVLVVFIVAIVGMMRMRRDMKRTMAAVGLLPEEQAPGTASYVASCVLLSIVGAATANQYSMKAILERYPRYFASIGGTREEVAQAQATLATPTTTSTTPTTGIAPAAQPSNVVALPVRGMAMPQQQSVGFQQQPNPQLVQQQPQLSPAAQRMQQLEPGARAGSLSHAESYEYAQMSEQVHGAEAAAPWYAYVVQTDPSNVLAAFWYGAYQLGTGDDAGLATLHRTLGDQRTAAYAQQRIVAYLQAQGRHEEAARYMAPTGLSAAA